MVVEDSNSVGSTGSNIWDGGNVAYNDYMKTVLTESEIASIFPATASAEYFGDMFEFWLGMLELGIQFPTMFAGWGPHLDNCLAGLEESFWLFSNSCRHADTVNIKRNRSRRANTPSVENAMVTQILNEAKIFDLLQQGLITRMPSIPKGNYDNLPETVEISSDEEAEEDEELDEGPTTPSARGSRKDQTSGETEMGEGDVKIEEEDDDMEGQPSETKKRRTEVRIIRDKFNEMIKKASEIKVCFICGGLHGSELKNVPMMMRTGQRLHLTICAPSWRNSRSLHRCQKSPVQVLQQEDERTNSQRKELCPKERDGTEPGLPRRKR